MPAGTGAQPASRHGQETAACQAAHLQAPAAGSSQGEQDQLRDQQATEFRRPSKLEPATDIPDDLQGIASFLFLKPFSSEDHTVLQ